MAVVRGERVLVEVRGNAAITHGQRLPGDFQAALDAAGVGADEIEMLAVAAGPGSFTGLRVGIASVQGLAFSRGLKVVPVSTLEALARVTSAHAPDGALLAPWMDAHRGEVFAALYEPDAATVIEPPSSASPSATLAGWSAAHGGRPIFFAGDGAITYRDTIREAVGGRGGILDPVPALAGAIGRLAAREPWRAVLPHAVVPVYVRRPDAELARQKRR